MSVSWDLIPSMCTVTTRGYFGFVRLLADRFGVFTLPLLPLREFSDLIGLVLGSCRFGSCLEMSFLRFVGL